MQLSRFNIRAARAQPGAYRGRGQRPFARPMRRRARAHSPDFINSAYIPGASVTPSMLYGVGTDSDMYSNPVELGEVLSADEVAQSGGFWSGVSTAIQTGVQAAGQILPMVTAWKIAKLNVQRTQAGQAPVSAANIVPSYDPMVRYTPTTPPAPAVAPAVKFGGIGLPLILAGGVLLFLTMRRR